MMALAVLHPQVAALELHPVILIHFLHHPLGIPQAGLTVYCPADVGKVVHTRHTREPNERNATIAKDVSLCGENDLAAFLFMET